MRKVTVCLTLVLSYFIVASLDYTAGILTDDQVKQLRYHVRQVLFAQTPSDQGDPNQIPGN